MNGPHHDIIVVTDQESLKVSAAALLVAAAEDALTNRGKFHLVLSGGGTPKPLYGLLTQEPYISLIPWSLTHIYWGDERSVPPDHEESNYKQAWERLLKHVSIPEDNIHRIEGELAAANAADNYTNVLAKLGDRGQHWPQFDLVLLGLGDDGHTASLFPGPISRAEQTRPVIAVKANYENRPADRVSLTPLVLNDSRKVIFMVAGSSKAKALEGSAGDKIDSVRWPAQYHFNHTGYISILFDNIVKFDPMKAFP